MLREKVESLDITVETRILSYVERNAHSDAMFKIHELEHASKLDVQ